MAKSYIDWDEPTPGESLGVWLFVAVFLSILLGGIWAYGKFSKPRVIETYQETRTIDEKLDFIYKTVEEIKDRDHQE